MRTPGSIREAGLNDLDRLRPVWEPLARHHAAIGSSPLQDDADLAWQVRRDSYARLIADARGFVLVAETRPDVVGYCAVALHDGPDDTFPVGDRWAEVSTLAVLPRDRNRGLGSALMDAAEARLGAMGVGDIAVAAMVENEAALAFYRRRGFVPREVVLWRFRAEGRTVYPRNDARDRPRPTAPFEESP